MSAILLGWWERSYTATRERAILHIIFWVGYLSFFSAAAFQHFELGKYLPKAASLFIWTSPVYLVGIFYFFVHTTYAAFQKRQFTKVALTATAAFVIYIHANTTFLYFMIRQLHAVGIPSKYDPINNFATFYSENVFNGVSIIHEAFWLTLCMFMPVGCKIFRDLLRSAQKLRELKERNMQLELNLIKSQVSPHFLLNTLNNIYGISINGTRQQIGDMILNLSDFLKYSLYECNQEFVPLSKEVKLIENFVELEVIRSEFIKTNFDINIDEPNYNIPPFILFPLIENAFKHGTQKAIEATCIKVELSVTKNRLNFRVENDIQTNNAAKGGIGLSALKKKIEYYYPEKSSFSSKVVDNRYIAELQINGL